MDLKDEIIDLLNIHLKSFKEAEKFSHKTDHATPSDTKNWSQIFCYLLILFINCFYLFILKLFTV